MKKAFLVLIAFLALWPVSAQELKVTLSPDKNKIHRDAGKGFATVVFDAPIKQLSIDNDQNDERIEVSKGLTFFLIPPMPEENVKSMGYPRRTFLLKTPETSEVKVDTPELFPNTVTYYTVVLTNQFPLSFSAEFLFSASAKYGVRISMGKQFGGYVSYKWGEYSPSGINLDNVQTDVDLTNATKLGYIRKSITAGARIGLFNKNIRRTNNGLYLLVGGGYGEYGRQWKNPTQIEGNVYFYSDYMKGFDAELALQVMACDWLSLSAGADMLIAKGNVSIDYMLGLGINLNFSKLKKKKL